MIRDLFSHKIHSSSNKWSEKLIDIATIFAEFDGKPYDRASIEKRFKEISPRVSTIGRDPSKFRDEISAYPAYLGLYRVELVNNIWHIFLSETTKKLLICEEPNVPAFLMLQLLLFQYPNGMGAAYTGVSDKIRLQANSSNRTLALIKNKIHISPLKLIIKGLLADSLINNTSSLKSKIRLDEVFCLANHHETNKSIDPDIDTVKQILINYREGHIQKAVNYERRFHILNHTNFLKTHKDFITLREALNENDEKRLINLFHALNKVNIQFNDFNNIRSENELCEHIKNSEWGIFFDGIKKLDRSIIELITNDEYTIDNSINIEQKNYNITEITKSDSTYNLRKISFNEESNYKSKKYHTYTYADKETTLIKRQKANLWHKILLEKLYHFLQIRGIESLENEHIDLYAKLPNNDHYIFEVKSVTTDNLLSQARKGMSQLYEYRYRYKHIIGNNIKLCLVFSKEPKEIKWLQQYLCEDREIGIIWFDGDQISYSTYCNEIIATLKAIN